MPERMRVVLADDHPAMLDCMAKLLSADYDVVATASDGCQAVKAVRQSRPDLLVLDICMPKMNGFEVVRQIQAEQIEPTTVFLTGQENREVVREARETGAGGVVVKPRIASDLLTAIKAARAGRFFSSPPTAP